MYSNTVMSGHQSDIVQKLERMGNLESVVAEQRMRIEKLKTTYEMLKAEHLQLKDVSFKYLTHSLYMCACML